MSTSSGKDKRYFSREKNDRQRTTAAAERTMYELWLKSAASRTKRTKSDRSSLRWLGKGAI